MEKQQMMGEVAARLASMGITCQYGAGADIVIQTEFLDASWGTGQKKIEYSASSYFDENEKVLYYWEFTKETGAGISFGSFSATSFQTGKTLFRKVKSIGYGPDGKAYEYSLDIGAIVRTFKDTAKQYGWKFKVVLNREKASYPPGYMPPVMPPQYAQGPQQQPPQQQYVAPQPYAQAPQYAQGPQQSIPSQPVPPPQQPPPQQPSPQQYAQYAGQQGPFYSQRSGGGPSGRQNQKRKGFMFYLPFGFILILAIALFIIGKVSVIGWAIGLVLLLVTFLARNAVLKKGCLTEIIIWIILMVLMFTAYLFTASENILNTDSNPDNTAGIPSASAAAANTAANSQAVRTSSPAKAPPSASVYVPYAIMDYQAGPFQNFRYVDSAAMKIRPVFQFNILINISSTTPATASSGPAEYKITNTRITKQPKIGTPVFCNSTLSQDTADTQNSAFTNGECSFSPEKGIEFSIVLNQLGVIYTYPAGTTNISGDKAITDAGVKADDLRCEASFDVEVKDKDGSTYYYPLQIELLPGDFLSNQQYVLVNFDSSNRSFKVR